MSKARNIADLLDANGDVALGNLDNVPPSNDASALTTGTLPVARLADGSVTAAKLDNSAKTVKSTTAPSSPNAGDLWFDTNTGIKVLKYYDGTVWNKVSPVIASLTGVTGNIIAGLGSTLTLTGLGFLSSNLTVNFAQASDGINVDVSVTPTTDTSATVTVPSSVYSNITGGNVCDIKVTNSDGSNSDKVSKTSISLPSGGTITTSGNYRIHTFTSSGTFTNGIPNLGVEYLVVAGGGGGGTQHAAGGGAGGFRTNVSGATSGRGASAEAAMTLSATSYGVTVGGGGAGSTGGTNGGRPRGSNGSDSSFNGISSAGGGGGGSWNGNEHGASGGCGGGGGAGSRIGSGGSGTSGQGYDGGTVPNTGVHGGGGGGGAAQNGSNSIGNNSTDSYGGNGGDGQVSSITGASTYYAGGGGGGTYPNFSSQGQGGNGGGGRGGYNGNSNTGIQAGSANTGGGGGCGAAWPVNGAAGGSGIVIVRYDLTSI